MSSYYEPLAQKLAKSTGLTAAFLKELSDTQLRQLELGMAKMSPAAWQEIARLKQCVLYDQFIQHTDAAIAQFDKLFITGGNLAELLCVTNQMISHYYHRKMLPKPATFGTSKFWLRTDVLELTRYAIISRVARHHKF